MSMEMPAPEQKTGPERIAQLENLIQLIRQDMAAYADGGGSLGNAEEYNEQERHLGIYEKELEELKRSE